MSHSILLSLPSHPHIFRHHPPPPTPFSGNLHLPHPSPFPLPPPLTAKSPPLPRSAAGDADKGKSNRELKLAITFGLWYAYNIIFNIYNKKALIVFPYPWLLASLQLAAGSLWMSVLWSANLQPRPAVSRPFLLTLLGPALFHAVGYISACVSFSQVAVSFTYVVKSAEPIFSVAFSAALGAPPSPPPPTRSPSGSPSSPSSSAAPSPPPPNPPSPPRGCGGPSSATSASSSATSTPRKTSPTSATSTG